MPSTSKKQSNFMKAVANNPKFAKRVGVSQKVGKDFEMADKKKGKYGSGGATKPKPLPVDPDYEDEGVMKPKPKPKPAPKPKPKPLPVDPDYEDEGVMKRKGGKVKKYAKGGGVFRSSANGIAKKGKTKARMPKMNKGGYC